MVEINKGIVYLCNYDGAEFTDKKECDEHERDLINTFFYEKSTIYGDDYDNMFYLGMAGDECIVVFDLENEEHVKMLKLLDERKGVNIINIWSEAEEDDCRYRIIGQYDDNDFYDYGTEKRYVSKAMSMLNKIVGRDNTRLAKVVLDELVDTLKINKED